MFKKTELFILAVLLIRVASSLNHGTMNSQQSQVLGLNMVYFHLFFTVLTEPKLHRIKHLKEYSVYLLILNTRSGLSNLYCLLSQKEEK